MPTVYFGTKDEPGFDLEQSDDLIAVRTRSGRSITRATGPVATPLSAELEDGKLVAAYPEAGVEVYRVAVDRGARSLTDRKTTLRASSDVRFAGGVLVDPVTKEPVLYTENLFIKFTDTVDPDDCVAVLRDAGLTVKNEVSYATNAYFVAAPEGTGQKVFAIAANLLKREDIEYCHPELIRPRARKGIFPQQWHLKKTAVSGVVVDAHANVEAAHEITRGEDVTIAIIDDGVDIDHTEFSGSGKVVAPRDASLQTNDPRPKDPFGSGPEDGENHGTACAGVACANGSNGASGVAPKARLIPIRLSSGLGSQREAEAFTWAADNGADVISCSWGPPDGRWWNQNDPRHHQAFPLPASTKLAIDYAVNNGRSGKGCVVLFAAGNGNESVDNDGYASYSKVIAVAACNDRGARSVYSDFGAAVWCAFPSSDFGHAPFNHPDPLTPGIWTTDRSGNDGYNVGNAAGGDVAGDYTNSFGGTSSSCPGAAGVAALVLSVNPNLRWHEVKDIFRRACNMIDPQGGGYDTSGHSLKYGYGRLNARTAVELAIPQPQSGVTISRTFEAPIPDLQTVSFTLNVADNTPVETLTVAVDLKHTYIGDLVITLQPPANTGVNPVMLHNRVGGSTKNLKKTYDVATTPALAAFSGKNCQGAWILQIQDAAAHDFGLLVSFSLGLSFTHQDFSPRVPEPKTEK
ncbi:MAG: S8 family serine peptidase [Candidatus Brocadiaceae bacterium]|nr:S8 family serine peptidase [Candidatus Brocadiaceae bacterium]